MLWFSWLQETERDELIQAKDRELAQIQQHLRQLRQKVILVSFHSRADNDHWYICQCVQEQSNMRESEFEDLKQQLQSSEANVTDHDFQKLLHRYSNM